MVGLLIGIAIAGLIVLYALANLCYRGYSHARDADLSAYRAERAAERAVDQVRQMQAAVDGDPPQATRHLRCLPDEVSDGRR